MLGTMSGGLERGPGPGALPDPDRVVIPDDASALQADLWALRAERNRRKRQAAMPADEPGTRGRLAGRMVPLLLGSLLLLGFLVSLSTTVRPATIRASDPAPLATTDVSDGQVGGLLPRGLVDVRGVTKSTRDLRPATLVLVPAGGASPLLLDSVYLQAQSYGAPMALVGPDERQALLASSAEDVRPAAVPVVLDRAEVIAESLGLRASPDPAIVVVGVDGRIHEVVENPPDGIQLQSALSRAAAGTDPAPR